MRKNAIAVGAAAIFIALASPASAQGMGPGGGMGGMGMGMWKGLSASFAPRISRRIARALGKVRVKGPALRASRRSFRRIAVSRSSPRGQIVAAELGLSQRFA